MSPITVTSAGFVFQWAMAKFLQIASVSEAASQTSGKTQCLAAITGLNLVESASKNRSREGFDCAIDSRKEKFASESRKFATTPSTVSASSCVVAADTLVAVTISRPAIRL